MKLSDARIKTLAAVGIIAFVLIMIGAFYLIDASPPAGTFVYEYALTDTAHVYVGVVVSTDEGFFLVEEENVWKGADWLNRHDFQLVDVRPVVAPESSARGMSTILALIFVRYKEGMDRERMRGIDALGTRESLTRI